MRRLTRYSIRSLLVLVTLACLVLGWYAVCVRGYREDQAALRAIENTHGIIWVIVDGKTTNPRFTCGWDDGGSAKLERVSPFGVHRLLGQHGDVFLRVRELTLRPVLLQNLRHLPINLQVVDELPRLRHLSTLTIRGPRLDQSVRDQITGSLPNTEVVFEDWPDPSEFDKLSQPPEVN